MLQVKPMSKSTSLPLKGSGRIRRRDSRIIEFAVGEAAFLRPRYYDPSVGRFLSMDSYAGNIADPASLHKYAYCNGDPINQIDPSGHFALALLTALVGLSAAIVAFSWFYLGVSFRAAFFNKPRTAVGVGGMDVTTPLLKTRQLMIQKIQNLPQPVFDKLFAQNSNIIDASQNWDITELYEAGGGAVVGEASKDRFVNGASIPRTVTVAGHVYEAPEVNYWLYGAIVRGIDERLGRPIGTGVGQAQQFIEFHRNIRYFGAGLQGREKWFQAGYYNDFAKAETSALPNAVPSAIPYNGVWYAYWGVLPNPGVEILNP